MSAGHIRRRGKASWELKFDLGPDPTTGRRRIRYHSFKGTRREAQVKLAELITAAGKGEYVDASKTTVAAHVGARIAQWRASEEISPKTAERYFQLLDNQIAPHLGSKLIQKLKPAEIESWHTTLKTNGRKDSRGGISNRTIGHAHRVLSKALRDAVRYNEVLKNVAAEEGPPKVNAKEMVILTEDQIGFVLRYFEKRRPSFHPIVALGLATGTRRGELCALRRVDVNLNAATVRIERAVEQTRGSIRIKEPKTKHSRRTIAIPPWMVTQLRAHMARQQERRLKLGQGRAPDDALLFPRWDGAIRSPYSLTQKFRQAMRKLKLAGVTFHSLRHTHASQLIASGMDVLTISRRLGHASPAITLTVYGHLFANTDARAAEIMEATFAKAHREVL
jgi:integrase